MPAAHRKGPNAGSGASGLEPDRRRRCQRTRRGGRSAAWLDGRAVIPPRSDRPGTGEGWDGSPGWSSGGPPHQEQPQRQTRGGRGRPGDGRLSASDEVRSAPRGRSVPPGRRAHSVSLEGWEADGPGSRGRGRVCACDSA